MDSLVLELLLVVFLCLLNGALSMSELALVSSNRGRLSAMASAGNSRAALALNLASNPSQMLATVQIGITCVGVLAGVLGGATIAEDFALWLNHVGLAAKLSEVAAFTLVVGVITYFSVVFGELIPKHIALAQPEKIATFVAWPVHTLARVCAPIVSILEYSSRSVLRIIPLASRNASLTDDDISHYLQQGVQDGGIRQVEKEIASRVFRLDDRPVRAFMTRRADIVQLDISLGLSENYKKVLESPHTFFPVGDGSLDSILGVISAKDFLVHTQSMPDVFPKHLIRPALFVRAHTDALSILELFKRERRHFAIVLDENSSVCGVVTTHDLMEAIVGDLADYEGEAQAIVRREDGSVLVEAYLDAQELLLYFGIELAEHEIPKEFHSVGGVLFANLPQVPKLGSKITWHGLCLEVVDMDGHRIDKVLVSRSLFNNSGETNFGVTNSS